MIQEYCPECGHLLPNSRSECGYCSWTDDNELRELLSGDLLIDDVTIFSLSKYPDIVSTAVL